MEEDEQIRQNTKLQARTEKVTVVPYKCTRSEKSRIGASWEVAQQVGPTAAQIMPQSH